ncbi:hypothetical protein [Streptomyces sp. SID5910]|uniref:hypothetical protein n=1 Tax=Streptomyces sp. SID5910 TaxID=2690312 RepID=UPI00136DE157|nr:hypothetical protein [Streptomyces sp. SID5910]MYR46588.1 hypothetical protein [Streptomyces sp. SID5910]
MPFVPQDVLDRLSKLEREVRELRGRSQMRPALTEILNGDVTIGEGGQLIVRAPGGVEILRLGDIYNPDNGVSEFGVIMKRRDGSVAMSLYNGTGTDEAQVLRLFDARGHGLLLEDVKAGGLYRPWIPYGTPIASDYKLWPHTSSTSWEEVARIRAPTQHPRLRYYLYGKWDGGVVAQSRITVDGTVIATSASGTPQMADIAEIPNYEYGKEVDVRIEARVVSGTGSVYLAPYALYGVGSAS